MLAMMACQGDELIEDLDLLAPPNRSIPLPDRHHQLPPRRHAHLPHIRSPGCFQGNILDEAIAPLSGAFQARQCAQMWLFVAASMSWAVMRTRLPLLRTLH